MKISVIIPVYKNKEQFMLLLKHNYPFISAHQIIIVDDFSQTNLKKDIFRSYKDIIVLENKKNLGFSRSVNRGVETASGEILFLLNSDVKLLSSSYESQLSLFEKDPKLFAISFCQIEKNGIRVGKNIIYFHKGMIMHSKAANIETGRSSWAEGGASLFKKSFFVEFGGFNPIYSPFYWEDIDLSYRAYKAGLHVRFEASITVEHHHESTISKYYDSNKIRTIAYRNQFIFIWKNISDPILLAKHIFLLPYNIIYYGLQKKDGQFINGFLAAIKQLPTILQKHNQASQKNKLSDKQILTMFKTL